MEYNTQRNKLTIPEYGRNIQKMINYCIEIPDRTKRNRTAEFIVNVMAQMNPKVKESADYRQKMWDHLHLIADFKLDVDSPYPLPPRDVLYTKPRRVKIDDRDFKFRHYGKNIELIIEKACEYPEGEEKEALIKMIANHLKKSYINWNKGAVDDEDIFKHLAILSNNRLKIGDDFKLHQTSEIIARNKKKRFIRPGQQNTGNGSNNYRPKRK